MISAQDGDADAYKTLLTALDHAIKNFLYTQFGPGELLEDCAQECLMAIHRARHTYQRQRPIRPWIFAIVRHKTIDVLRQSRPRVEVEQSLETAVDATHISYADSAEPELDTSTLLNSLSQNLREPLYMTKCLGLTNRECAERLGITEGTVKVRVFRALQKLKRHWQTELTTEHAQ